MWSLEEGRYVAVTMEKRRKTWWKTALAGGEEIDTQATPHPTPPHPTLRVKCAA